MLHAVVGASIFAIQIWWKNSPWIMEVALKESCRDIEVRGVV